MKKPYMATKFLVLSYEPQTPFDGFLQIVFVTDFN